MLNRQQPPWPRARRLCMAHIALAIVWMATTLTLVFTASDIP